MANRRSLTWRPLPEIAKGSPPTQSEPGVGGAPPLLNRNLSWLQFNDRVLSEAADPTVPPAERLRFIGIVSSNLDEFFMIRVAQVLKRIRRTPSHRYPDGLTPGHLLERIREHVLNQKARQAVIFKDVQTALKKEGIHIHSEFTRNEKWDQEIKRFLPLTQAIVLKPNESIPPLDSEKIYVYFRFTNEMGLISIKERESRLIQLSPPGRPLHFALLERWLCQRGRLLFPKKEIIEAFPFKLLRDADLRFRVDEEDLHEDQILNAAKNTLKAQIVRLEVDASSYSDGVFSLATALGVASPSLYRFDLPLDLRLLNKIINIPHLKRLCYYPIKPRLPKKWAGTKNIFKLIESQDILLHHPYDSFDLVVHFLETAATDPSVVRIHHTMYRTSHESPIMEALKQAAQNGKRVMAYIEIKARFDELNNINWANDLRKAGVRVVRALGGYKVHSKMTLVTRREEGQEVSYLHLGTGNYHPHTARVYTDLGFLTKDQLLGHEANSFFRDISHRKSPTGLKEILVAPGNLHNEFLRRIKEETKIQKSLGKGHIIAKMNSLVDPDIINALYQASSAGVRIDLLVRGICCLRPQIKGLSENIRVKSIIDRFLEHSRIYYFRANGKEDVYLSSADWMPRNFYTRFEMAFPIKDASLKRYIREIILAQSLADNLKSWEMKPDGTYEKVQPQPTEKVVRSQLAFEVLARKSYKETTLFHRRHQP